VPRANGNNSSALSTPGAGLEPHEVSFACTVWFCMIVAYAALQLTTPFAASGAFRTPYVAADFAEFYIAGKILNQHGADALYDLDLQTRLFHQLDAGNHDAKLWYVCAPYLAQIFRPFALLSFHSAYIAWMIVAILTYGIGVGALSPYLAGLPAPYRRAALLLGLTFVPVALWSLVGGQIGVIAFAIIAWCVRFDLSGKQLAAGATLALCCYKPTLLLLRSISSSANELPFSAGIRSRAERLACRLFTRQHQGGFRLVGVNVNLWAIRVAGKLSLAGCLACADRCESFRAKNERL